MTGGGSSRQNDVSVKNRICGCSSVVEHLLAKERVESSNLFIRFETLLFSLVLFPTFYLLSLASDSFAAQIQFVRRSLVDLLSLDIFAQFS